MNNFPHNSTSSMDEDHDDDEDNDHSSEEDEGIDSDFQIMFGRSVYIRRDDACVRFLTCV